MTALCEYCGQEERYGHNAICVMNTVEELRAEIDRLRAVITRAKDALLDGQSTQWVHDLLVTALVAHLEPKP